MITHIIKLESLPRLMKNLENWVLYSLFSDPKPDDAEHKGKYPIDPKAHVNRIGGIYYKGAKSNDADTWGTFYTAYGLLDRMHGSSYRISKPLKKKDGSTEWQYTQSTVSGLGFELEGSGITCIDIDNCADEIQEYQNGRRGGLIASILDIIGSVSYVEVSQSGRGLHIFTKGAKPKDARSKGGGLEIYDSKRFIAMTGNVFCDFHTLDDADHSAELAEICRRYMPQQLPSVRSRKAAVDSMRCCNVDIMKALETAGRTNRKFPRLWSGDRSQNISESDPGGGSADLALCNILCYYLAGDYNKIDAAFRCSGLMRPKWDERRGAQTYGEMTINKSLSLYGNDDDNYFDYAADFREELTEADREQIKNLGGTDNE